MIKTDPLAHITHYIVIKNPQSTRAAEADTYLTELEAATKRKLTVIETVKGSAAANRDQLINAIKHPSKEALIVLGGDGTWRLICSALLDKKTPKAVQGVLLIKLPGGNADDGFQSMHARKWRRDPAKLLHDARADRKIIQMYPLQCEIIKPNGDTDTELAMNYITLGTTAAAARILNSSWHRKHKRKYPRGMHLLVDMLHGAPSLLRFPHRYRVDLGTEHRRVTELQFVNSPIMTEHAKYPVKLSEKIMHFGAIHNNDPFIMLFTALRIYLGKPPGTRTSQTISLTLTDSRSMPAQLDGEYLRVTSGSTLHIGHGPLYLNVLATKENA